jgi:hypothetical protein
MKRILGRASFVAGAALFALAMTPACAENDVSLFIRNAMAPPQSRANGRCLYTADPGQPMIAGGVVDFAIRDNYVVSLLVGSQLTPRGDQTQVRSESNRTHLNGAVVKLTDANGGLIREYTSLTSGFVDVSQGATATYGIADVTALDAPALAAASSGIEPGDSRLVVANIKVFGKTLGGVDVETGEFQFPIHVCNRCLLDFSTGDDPAVEGRDCNLNANAGGAAGGATGTAQVIPCHPGQDELTPCQLCRDAPPPRGEACRGQ